MSIISDLIVDLNEGVNDYYLYHATSGKQSLIDLFEHNRLYSKSKYMPTEDKEYYGLCLTRSYKFAQDWVRSDIIIVFDKQKLQRKFKLIPRGNTGFYVQNKLSHTNKEEEFLVNPKGKGSYFENIKDYIIEIQIRPNVIKNQDKVLDTFRGNNYIIKELDN